MARVHCREKRGRIQLLTRLERAGQQQDRREITFRADKATAMTGSLPSAKAELSLAIDAAPGSAAATISSAAGAAIVIVQSR